MTNRYATILANCLEREEKSQRDAVLAELSPEIRVIICSQLQGIARRLTAYIVHAGAREHHLSAEQRRQLRRERLAAIKERWLRERVEAMVRERFETREHRPQEMIR